MGRVERKIVINTDFQYRLIDKVVLTVTFSTFLIFRYFTFIKSLDFKRNRYISNCNTRDC